MSIVKAPFPQTAFVGRRSVVTHARSYGRGTRLGEHVHWEAQLLFASSGVMQVTTPRGRWLVPPQRAVWLPPRFEHAVDVLADIEMRTLYLSPEWLSGCDGGPRLDREFVVAVQPLLRALITALFDEPRHPRRTDLLAKLALSELVEAEDAATFMPMPKDPRALRIAKMVLSDPASSREMEDLALASGVSARTVTRLFPAETNITFREWRQRARIMVAVEVLGCGKPSIKQVAAKLGFSSVAAFSHAFSQVMGVTPTEFRKQAATLS
jgi:AraC-like DNA-binding protein